MATPIPYEMQDYVWFQVEPLLPRCPTPFYLGHGVALTPAYNSLTNYQQPMPDHGILKIALSPGGLFGSDAGETQLAPGDAIVRIFGERHVWDRYDPQHHGPWEFLGLIFSGEAAISMLHGIIERFGRVLRFPLQSPLMNRLMAIARSPSHGLSMAASDAARLVTDVLMTLAETTEHPVRTTPGDRLIADALATIQQRMAHDLSVHELADLHHVSREHLTRVFTQKLGQPPARLIAQEKIAEACRLLRHTRLPIKTIMRRVGYDSPSTFFRVFKQVAATTPGEFRRQGRDLAVHHFEDAVQSDRPQAQK